MNKREELLAELAEIDKKETEQQEIESADFVSLSELSGNAAKVIFEKDIKYYVVKKGEKILLEGKVKITDLIALQLIDLTQSFSTIENITFENLEKITTIDKLETLLESTFEVRKFESGEKYDIKDSVEKLETVTAIIKLATPTIKEEAAKRGNRASRRSAKK